MAKPLPPDRFSQARPPARLPESTLAACTGKVRAIFCIDEVLKGAGQARALLPFKVMMLTPGVLCRYFVEGDMHILTLTVEADQAQFIESLLIANRTSFARVGMGQG